jgi:p-cymene methyl-monooxygenase electron transfer component
MSLFSKLFAKAPPRTVLVQPGGKTFPVSAGETVLERALKEGLAYPHDCTVGTCGTCRTKLISGKVDAITPFSYTLSREELEAGYILACQAVPKSDLVIEVEISSQATTPATTQRAKLISAEPLTHDIKRVSWAVETPLQYRAGQYANIRWRDTSGNREPQELSETHRSYSFATAPTAGGLTELSSFIRHVPGGAFTDLLFDGDPSALDYEIDGPHGNFWLRDGTGPIVCIAGGSGLAPIVSLLQDAANRKIRRDCVLLFGARGVRDLYGAEDIAMIRAGWSGGFDYRPVLSEERAEGYRHGFVTEHLGEALTRLGGGAQGYLCGPPPMVDAGIKGLTEAGIPLGDVHYDKFTDASSSAR